MILAMFLYLLASGPPGSPAPKPVNVCAVLLHLEEYRNKRVSIRGELLVHPHGTVLRMEKCPVPLITSGHVWPTMIYLIPADSNLAESPGRVPPGFSVDRAWAPVLEKGSRERDARLWVTVVGRLETRRRFEIVERGDGKTLPVGYGHLNAYPAQLVYEEFKDVLARK